MYESMHVCMYACMKIFYKKNWKNPNKKFGWARRASPMELEKNGPYGGNFYIVFKFKKKIKVVVQDFLVDRWRFDLLCGQHMSRCKLL